MPMASTYEPDDAAVIRQSLRTPERFAVIFDRHAPHILRYLARRLGRQAADDALSETFIAAFGRRARYDAGRTDARPWLYGIASNVVSQRRRDEVRELRLLLALPGPQTGEDCHADRVSTAVAAGSTRAALVTALARLADGDRDVLLLIGWEHLTYGEVALALDIPVGTVRSRLHRARTLVRQALANTGSTSTIEEILHG
jgi:RNA polymerase sigma factor (sigma-70 family)